MDDQMANGRVTNQDIDRRVGRLEEVQNTQGDRLHELGNQVNLIGLKQEHSEKLFSSEFDQVFTRLDRLIERTETEAVGFQELTASPAGRVAERRLLDLEEGRKSNAERISKVEQRILQASAVLGAIAFLMPLLAPMIAGWLGLPK